MLSGERKDKKNKLSTVNFQNTIVKINNKIKEVITKNNSQDDGSEEEKNKKDDVIDVKNVGNSIAGELEKCEAENDIKPKLLIDLQKDDIRKAFIYSEILGQPKCKKRARRI